MSKTTTHGAEVKARIIATGLRLWRAYGAAGVSARRIGAELKMTHGAVLYHFQTAENMRDAVAHEAVRLLDPCIVPQLIVSRHDAISPLTQDQRAAFMSGY